MLGFGGLKYRAETNVEIHAILMQIPHLKDLLADFLHLKKTISEFQKTGATPIEAAANISLLMLERIIAETPKEARDVALKHLDQDDDGWFLAFPKIYADFKNGTSEYPTGMPLLAFAIGFACWYLGKAFRERRLREAAYKIFVLDVVNMLHGMTADDRRSARIRIELS